MRTIWNAIQYLLRTGSQWANLSKDFSSFTTVQYHVYRFHGRWLFNGMSEALVGVVRLLSGRNPEPTAGIIDSQSVKTAQSDGSDLIE